MNRRRFFTLVEANSMVPWLKQSFARILQLRSQLRGHQQSLEQQGYSPEDPQRSGAAGPPEIRVLHARWSGLLAALQAELRAILAEGVEVKDLEQGLCDFWATVDGREVYLCWRLGEERIDFYHDPHAGVAGRRPLVPAKPGILH
jgi:hypothetical protein